MHSVFESMRSYNGKVFMLDEHIQRFFESCRTCAFSVSMERKKLKDIIKTRLKESKHKHAYIRMSIDESGSLSIIIKKFKPHRQAFYKKGISIKTAAVKRNLHKAQEPKIKSQDFLNGILAKAESIYNHGQFDSLMLSNDGFVAEATVSNIFLIKDGKLCTPPNHVGILEGITKRFVESLAKGIKVPICKTPFTRHDLYNANEVFLTNTSMEIMPVVCVDGRKIGAGTPGALTKKIHSLFRKEIGKWSK